MKQDIKDIFGNSEILTQPIFTENEVVKYKSNIRLYYVTIIMLFLLESNFHSYTAELFLKPDAIKNAPWIKYIFGFSFAIIFIYALHVAFKNIWIFIEAKYLIEKNSYNINLLKPFYVNIILAAIILAIYTVSHIYTIYIWIIMIEPYHHSTNHFLNIIHGPLVILAILITFVTALIMALLEKEITEKSNKYKAFVYWKREQSKKNKR